MADGISDGYGASAGAIRMAGQQAEDAAQKVEGVRRGVWTTVEELTAANWQGAASVRFKTAMGKWNEQALKIRGDLDNIARELGVTSINYSSQEQDVNEQMTRVDSMINFAE